jgi:hypothetical protein
MQMPFWKSDMKQLQATRRETSAGWQPDSNIGLKHTRHFEFRGRGAPVELLKKADGLRLACMRAEA